MPEGTTHATMGTALRDYYRCPESFVDLGLAGELSGKAGYFKFGEGTICYGQSSAGFCATTAGNQLYDAFQDLRIVGSTCFLPFSPTQVISNLRHEHYVCPSPSGGRKAGAGKLAKNLYYFVRPWMPVAVRKHLQRVYLHNRKTAAFPNWPVDRTVEQILEKLLSLSFHTHGRRKIPFIWFWPEGYRHCAIITHDVETSAGRDFCAALMELDASFGIKSSFQIVPEKRYEITAEFLSSVRERGCEINLHGLDHEGDLFEDREEFLQRVQHINRYAKRFGTAGFRSPVLYRNPNWYEALDFSYDMSVPNAGHLDPQPGGCCTVMPYFIGNMVELPVTTTQDYSLFHILNDYSLELWNRQIDLIMEKHGLISFIVHPDYLISARARDTYKTLLEHLSERRRRDRIWFALPREVDHWWRQRSGMKLVMQGGDWHIEGEGRERARVAYIGFDDNAIVFDTPRLT